MDVELRSAVKAAHKKSIYHRESLRKSKECGCFYCLDIFNYGSIKFWTDNDNTALCPTCDIDSVLGDDSGYPITKEFLGAMKTVWFDE